MTELFSISSNVLPPETRVLAFTGREAISQPYSFEIYLTLASAESDAFDMERALNGRASLLIHHADGEPRATIHGVLSTVEFVHALPGDALYRAVLVPEFWQLTLTEHSRIFTNKSAPEFIEATLRAGGLRTDDFEFRLARQYQPLDHVCQYRESHFEFVSRWMEREGLYYFFEQGADREKLIITDDKSHHEPLASSPIRYFPHDGDETTGIEAFGGFTCQHRAMPARVRLKDYDYLKPSVDVSGAASVWSHGRGEISEFGENFSNSNEGRRLATTRAQELQARQVVYHARGRVYDVRPGYLFDLDEHPRAAFNTRYLTTELEHHGSNAVGQDAVSRVLGIDAANSYRVQASAIQASVQFRAERRTAWPRIYGIETAIVDGPATSDYAQIDEHGRYAVKVLFDESDLSGGRASMMVRMLQPHGGSPEGFHFPLRKGTEVSLVFLGGDPDRPVISAVAPNAETPSPVTANNHTLNVIQTGGENRVEIQDAEGAEYVKLTTPHKRTMLHLGAPHNPDHNIQLQTEGDARFEYGTDWDVHAGGHLVERIDAEVRETYGSTMDTIVASNKSLVVGANEAITIAGNQTTTVTGFRNVEVTGAQRHAVHSTDELEVTGQQTITIEGGQVINVSGSGRRETIDGPLQQDVSANLDVRVGANMTQTVGGSIQTTVSGQHQLNVLGAQVSFNAQNVSHTVLGVSNQNQIGAKFDTHIGVHTSTEVAALIQTLIGLHVALAIGPSIHIDAAVSIGKHGVKLTDIDLEVKNCPTKLEAGAVWVCDKAISIFA